MSRSSPARRSGRSALTDSHVSAVTPMTTTTTEAARPSTSLPTESAIALEVSAVGDVHVGALRAGVLTARRHVAHSVLGDRGDGEARVDADVRGDRRPVADEQVLVAEGAMVGVDDARPRALADDGAAHDVRGGRDVEQRLGDARLRGRVELLGRAPRDRVGQLDEARVRLVRVLLRLAPRAPGERGAPLPAPGPR